MKNTENTQTVQVQLNALADGELDPAMEAEVRSQIDRDPQLAAQYERIRETKDRISRAGLASLPEPAAHTSRVYRPRHQRSWQPWAVAASFAAIAGLVALLLLGSGLSATSSPQGILAWHQHFSDRHYVVEKSAHKQLVSFASSGDFDVPDLIAARLFLVDYRVTETNKPEAVFHYRGLKGCRLTLLYSEAGLDVPEKAGQIRTWTLSKATLAMIASGMDADRFRAIGNYIETMSRQNDGNRQRLAMGDVTRSARSCA